MHIKVKTNDIVTITITGMANMKHEVTMSKDDAEQLAELLRSDEGGSFSTTSL